MLLLFQTMWVIPGNPIFANGNASSKCDKAIEDIEVLRFDF